MKDFISTATALFFVALVFIVQVALGLGLPALLILALIKFLFGGK